MSYISVGSSGKYKGKYASTCCNNGSRIASARISSQLSHAMIIIFNRYEIWKIKCVLLQIHKISTNQVYF